MNQDEIKRRIQNVVKRLQDLLEFNAPDSVICTDVALLVRWCLCFPDGPNTENLMGDALGKVLATTTRNFYGFCDRCLGDLPPEYNDTICPTCKEKDDKEFGHDN